MKKSSFDSKPLQRWTLICLLSGFGLLGVAALFPRHTVERMSYTEADAEEYLQASVNLHAVIGGSHQHGERPIEDPKAKRRKKNAVVEVHAPKDDELQAATERFERIKAKRDGIGDGIGWMVRILTGLGVACLLTGCGFHLRIKVLSSK